MSAVTSASQKPAGCLAGGGAMGELMRGFDWGQTPVGVADEWPQSLRTAVSIILESRFPMYVAWGEEYTQFYNDGYRPILGASKHPGAMGTGACHTFPEIWDIIGPMFDDVRRGTSCGQEDWMLPLERNGYLEECSFTFSYSPVRDESGSVGGVLVTVVETTSRVLAERRLQTLRDLAALASKATDENATWRSALEILHQNPRDFAFTALYCRNEDQSFSRAGVFGLPEEAIDRVAPATWIDHGLWPHLSELDGPVLITDFVKRFGRMAGAAWPESVHTAVLLPVRKRQLHGLLIVGISPRLHYDAHYRDVLVLAADHIATGIGNVRGREEERRRVQSLAELRAEAQAARDEAIGVLESITDGFFALDRAWRFTYVNGTGGQLIGLRSEELLGRNFWEVFAPALGTSIERDYRHAMDDRVPVEFELLYEPWKRWFAVKAFPVEQGGISAYFREITQQKKAEQAVRESEEQFRTMADNIPSLAWMAHADGDIFWYNQRWSEYTGRSPEEMRGWGWKSVHRPDMLPLVMERWQEALRTGEVFDMEFPLLGADGKFRWFLTQVRPIRNEAGEIVRWFGTNANIDEKKRMVEALRQSEELARSVIENNPDGVEVLDLQGRRVLSNERCRELRATIAGPDGADLPWLQLWGEPDLSHVSEALAGALGGQGARFEVSLPQPSGATVWLEVSLTPLLGTPLSGTESPGTKRAGPLETGGEVARILCLTRDTTRTRKAEQELRQTAKLESLGVMAGGIAHDFNNLLTGILGNASLLSEFVSEKDKSMADDIVLASERAADLTRQMLAFAGKGRFEIATKDLGTLVREILRLARPSIAKNVDIQVELEDGCFVEGDPVQLQQVIMNLIINAGDAMEGRPGRIVVRTAKVSMDRAEIARRFAVSAGEPGDYIDLEVSDNGKGMDEKTKARIFDPFFTTKFTGRGLGLAAVSGIVRGHKGMLRVDSHPGVGTTFHVAFPCAQKTDAAPGKSEVSGGGARRILFVDDEEIVRRVGLHVLEKGGHKVRLAGNGEEALAVFRACRGEIDLIVLDLTMPAMNGEEALRAIRAIDSAVPAMICSGYSEVEMVRRFTLQNVNAFLQKPFTSDQLLAKVRQIFDPAL